MISPETAVLAISIAKGIVKLAARIDRLTAEKEAVTGALFIPMPPEGGIPDVDSALPLLRKYLKDTEGMDPDPLEADRERLAEILDAVPVPDEWIGFFERLFPEQAHPPLVSPEAEYLTALRKWVPSVNWDPKTNPEVCKAAFYIAAGRDQRELGYGARLGLLVADVIAEFGAENTSLFLRDKNAQEVVGAVLRRLSTGDLESFEEWSPFLRHALSATLNGLLDARAVAAGHAVWIDALLEGLARARDGAEAPDDYLLGLVTGSGYSRLIGEGMKLAAETLGKRDAGVFTNIVATFLGDAAKMVTANKNDFGTFFNEHWADLLNGGIRAVAQHGPRLIEGQSPLLRTTLLAVMKQLETVDTSEFSADTALGLAEAAIGAVARDPKLLEGVGGTKWVRTLVGSVATTLGDAGLRATFSRDGLERLFRDTLGTFAKHPELIISNPGLARDVVGEVLGAIARTQGMEGTALANAAVAGALQGLSGHPELAGSKFGPYVAEVAGILAKAVKDQGIGSIQAADLVDIVVQSMLRNPQLFATLESNVAAAVLQALLKAADVPDDAQAQATLLAGSTLVDVTRSILVEVARQGTGFVESHSVRILANRVAEAVDAGLERASKELGRRMDREALPAVLATLVRKVLSGELSDLDPGSDNFKKLFSQIADAVTAQSLLTPSKP